MGNSIGERTLFTITGGRSIQVSADGAPKYKAGGVTVDWTTVTACPSNGTAYYGVTVANGVAIFEDSVQVAVGDKAIRYGTILMKDSGTGKYRPALTADGASLKRSETYIVNETWLEADNMSVHPGAIDGGRVFEARIGHVGNMATYNGTAVPPTKAQVEAVMPGIVYAID
jgi:hypothetical protein